MKDHRGEGKEERSLEGGVHKDWQHRRKVFWNQQHGVRSACPHWERTVKQPEVQKAQNWSYPCQRLWTGSTRTYHLVLLRCLMKLPPDLASPHQDKEPSLSVPSPFSKENSNSFLSSDWHHRTILKNKGWFYSGSKTKQMLPPDSKEALWWRESFWGLGDTGSPKANRPGIFQASRIWD